MTSLKLAPAPLAAARNPEALRAAVRAWRGGGRRIGFVPTMGALHEGHLSLVRAAKAQCDRVVASVFVNPKQFAPHEDFERYPRDEAGDAALLQEAGCDLLFAPEHTAMYPPGFGTAVIVSGVSTPLEGEMRPHFFGGVATVVAKLLIQCMADAAYFGEKDYQQLLVIRRLARDLDLQVEIVGCPTVREPDGLAMSSRNAYLSKQERNIAASLNVALKDAVAQLRAGAPLAQTEAAVKQALIGAGFGVVDYVALRDAETLEPIEKLERPARILAAAWLGKTRLIDNMEV